MENVNSNSGERREYTLEEKLDYWTRKRTYNLGMTMFLQNLSTKYSSTDMNQRYITDLMAMVDKSTKYINTRISVLNNKTESKEIF